jgi:murein DD-endopeptidase MepM/ murein hydrolase activator NlpD
MKAPRSARQLINILLLIAIIAALYPVIAMAAPQTQPAAPPFGLPFASAPGPSTWYIIQYYGNTTSAYIWRYQWYGAGQGLHFGVDFAARCGTEVVAVGDGIVAKVDEMGHGSGPHNLMIDHPEAGYASFYGHLLEEPRLAVGQKVNRGDVVALSGDPDLTCTSRPHLHLEIRSIGYWIAYNPVPLIDADWNTLALFGGGAFQRDLDDPRRWDTPDDQPDVQFGKPLLNDYSNPWPPDWSY